MSLWMTPQVAIELTGEAGFVSFGDVSALGISADGTDSSGSSVGIDAGLRVLLGG